MPEDIEPGIVISIHKPNLKEYLFFFISGVIISIPFGVFYESFADRFCFLLPFFPAQLCSIVILAPLIEEFAKAYPLFYRHGETQRSVFTLALVTGLGFGVTEFFIYIFIVQAPIIVRIPGLFFHAASTSIVGYGIATKKPATYYLVAVLLHFSYNFFTFLGDFWYVGGPLVLLLSYLLSLQLYRKTSDKVAVS